jgi:hypothetical protein
MRSQRRSKWRDWRAGWRWSWITTGAAILVVVLIWGYLNTRVPAWVANDCRGLYAQARTPTDSAAVDDEFVWRRIGGRWNCGMLRRIGATEPKPR